MRSVLVAMFLVLAPTMAMAVTKDEVKEYKADWKAEKKALKEIESISKRWLKAEGKNDLSAMHKADADLVEFRRVALDGLRDAGVVAKANVDDGAPKMEAYRDLLVELRDGQARFDEETAGPDMRKRKAELLAAVEAEVAKRVARREFRWREAKDKL